ncbi:MAG: respiratory nitrate reductase subunit gamma [Syntrophobacteria bacterium]
MSVLNTLAFVVFPYLALTTFVVGHLYRYLTNPYDWNSKSSELLDKEGLKIGITIFHWGIIFALLGHGAGLLIPQRYWDALGINSQAHTLFATYSGFVVGAAALLGLALLISRRISKDRILATTTLNDFVTLGLLFFVVATGFANVVSGLFDHFDILNTIAPWLRGILTLTPDASLMLKVPLRFKIHILAVLTLLGFSPFSRLVHIWSVPLTYLFRRLIVFRRREVSL